MSYSAHPAHTRRSTNVDTIFGQLRRRRANIVPALGEIIVFARPDIMCLTCEKAPRPPFPSSSTSDE